MIELCCYLGVCPLGDEDKGGYRALERNVNASSEGQYWEASRREENMWIALQKNSGDINNQQ